MCGGVCAEYAHREYVERAVEFIGLWSGDCVGWEGVCRVRGEGCVRRVEQGM